MKFSIQNKKTVLNTATVLAIFLFEGEKELTLAFANLPQSLRAEAESLAKNARFTAKNKTTFVFPTHQKIFSSVVIFIGLGDAHASHSEIRDFLREASAEAGKIASTYQAKKMGVIFSDNLSKLLNKNDIGQAIAEGAELGAYSFQKYKKQDDDELHKNSVCDIVIEGSDRALLLGAKQGSIIAEGVCCARNLVNEPANNMKPEDLLKQAKQISAQSPNIKLAFLNKTQLTKMGFGGILGVSQGSVHQPYLIHLSFVPKQKNSSKKLCFIGKGITFDSGGLSLKPSEYMENMKTDMAGAAAVLGLFSIISRLSINREVHGIIPTCENMVSGDSIRPGDIITMKDKTTVEVLNTDAEGRIVLADAVCYARECKVDEIIDLATLTGACIVALGNSIAGVLGNNSDIIRALLEAGNLAGEKLWELPLEETYKENLKSEVAVLRNISTMKVAGTINGALFLEHFIGKTPWAHLDIAGPAWVDKPLNAYTGKGATGFGVRTMAEYLMENRK